MAENKKQHFVPRFYLEHFSFDGGTRTNLIRIEDLKSVAGISVKNQCQEDNFYGKDLGMERALADIEGAAARVIKEVIAKGSPPTAGTPGGAVLRAHICLQWVRTAAYVEGSESAMSQMLKIAYRGELKRTGLSQEKLDGVEFGTPEAPKNAVVQGADYIPFFWDLELKLVVANGLGEFVTSDDPVVLINPHYLGRFPGGIAGPALEGTVILWPLSPDYLIVLYDRGCYRVGAAGKVVVPLGSISDLVALNNHQFLNAADNVYHRSQDASVGHLVEFAKVKGLRLAERQVVREIPLGDRRSFLHSYTEPINYKPPTSFLKVRRDRRGETAPVPQIPDRNPAISHHFKAYDDALQAGRVPKGFVGYIVRMAETIH